MEAHLTETAQGCLDQMGSITKPTTNLAIRIKLINRFKAPVVRLISSILIPVGRKVTETSTRVEERLA